MSLAQIRTHQEQTLNAHLLVLIERQKQTENARDLAPSPTDRARLDAEVDTIRLDIVRYKSDLEQLEAEIKNAQLLADGHSPIIESYRARLNDSLPDAELNDLFRIEVQSVMEVLKYDVSHDVVLGISGTSPPTFVAIQEGDFEPMRSLIQCTFGIVDEDAVRALQSIFDRNRTPLRLRLAVLVTNTYVAPSASRLANEYQMQLLTFEELLNTVFRLSNYLKEWCRDYEHTNKLYHTYVEIKYLRKGTGKFNDNRSTLEESLAAEDPGGAWFEAKGELTPYADTWLLAPGGGQICLLGEYGTGKTSFAAQYFWRRATAYLLNPLSNRIPVLIPLGRYHKSADIEQMITSFLVNECGIRRDFRTFLSMAARGKLLVILDGFDEMAKQVDINVRRHNFREIARLLVGGNKVILSGRPNYFLSREEIAESLEQTVANDPYRAAMHSATGEGGPCYQILSVTLFDRWQIEEFLKKQSVYLQLEGIEGWRDLQKVISNTYNLEELSRTPVLLEIIIKTVSELRGKVTDINAAKLYEIYTNFWLDREYDKGDVRWLITRQDKEIFVLELSWSMLLTDNTRPEIHFSALSEHVRAYFSLDRASDIDYFSSDIRFCSFLVHSDADGNYRFIHKSFMEYFCSRRIYKEAVEGGNVRRIITSKPLPDEVVFFLSQMMDASAIEKLSRLAREEQQEATKTFAVALVERLLRESIKVDQRRGVIHDEESGLRRLLAHCREFNLTPGLLWSLISLGQLNSRLARLDEATLNFEEALEAAQGQGDPVSESRALVELGAISQVRGDLDSAAQCYRRGWELLEPLGVSVDLGTILIKTGLLARSVRQLVEANEQFRRALDIFERLQDRSMIGESLKMIAGVCRDQADYAAALEHLQRALAVFRELGDTRSESRVAVEVAEVYRDMGRLADAEGMLGVALEVVRANRDFLSEARVLEGLAQVCSISGRLQEAFDLLSETVRLGQEVGDLDTVGNALARIGTVLEALGRPEEALQSLGEALEIREVIGDKVNTGSTLIKIATIYTSLEHFGKAREAFRRALSIFEELRDIGGTSAAIQRLGMLALREGDLSEAEELLTKALTQKQAVLDRLGEADVSESLGQLEEKRGDGQKARALYEVSLRIYSEIGVQDRTCDLYLRLASLAQEDHDNEMFVESYRRYRDLAQKLGRRTDANLDQRFQQLGLTSMANVFTPTIPATERLGFAGRATELEMVLESIKLGRHVMIVGDRGMGKTSLLRQIVRRLEDPFVPVVVNLAQSPGLLNDIFQTVADAFSRHKLVSTKRWTHAPINYASDFPRALESLLEEAREHDRRVRLVLLVDDAEWMGEPDDETSLALRQALQHVEKVVGVFSAARLFEPKTSRRSLASSPLWNFITITLGPLTASDVSAFILASIAQSGVKFTKGAMKAVFDWSGGIPMYVQMVAYEAVKEAGDLSTKVSIDASLVNRVAGQMIFRWGDVLDSHLRQLDHRKGDLMRLIALNEGESTTRGRGHELAELERHGKIRNEGGRYRITSRLLELWLQRPH